MPPKTTDIKKCILVKVFKEQLNIEKASDIILNYLGSICNIPIEDFKDFDKFEEIEVNGVVTIFIFHQNKKYELLSKLLSKNVRNEKPGILMTEAQAVNELPNERTVDELGLNDNYQSQNQATTHNETCLNNGIDGKIESLEEGGIIDNPMTSLRGNFPISKSFELLAIRDDKEWKSLNQEYQNNVEFKRFANKCLGEQKELEKRLDRMGKTMDDMSRKLDVLDEYLPKILKAIQSNQAALFGRKSDDLQLDLQSEIEEINNNKRKEICMVVSDDDIEKNIFKDEMHRIYFKKLLIDFINTKVPERAKNLGLDKLKVEFPHLIQNIKDSFEKECIVKNVSDWKKMWNYAVDARKKKRFN